MREGKSGYLLVGGLLDNVIYKIAADNDRVGVHGEGRLHRNRRDHTGTQTRSGRSHVLLIGPSCASLDSQGRLIWCADNDRTVMRLEKDGTRTVLSAGSNGKRFSGPNDIVVRADDGVYLTDNDFGLRDAAEIPTSRCRTASGSSKTDGRRWCWTRPRSAGSRTASRCRRTSVLYLTALQKIMRYEVKPEARSARAACSPRAPVSATA